MSGAARNNIFLEPQVLSATARLRRRLVEGQPETDGLSENARETILAWPQTKAAAQQAPSKGEKRASEEHLSTATSAANVAQVLTHSPVREGADSRGRRRESQGIL